MAASRTDRADSVILINVDVRLVTVIYSGYVYTQQVEYLYVPVTRYVFSDFYLITAAGQSVSDG